MICGAVISDNNTDGIGWGCMANVVKPAIKETMWEVYGLDIWVAKANRIKEAFLNAYAGVKFRNEFKRGFYESMAKAERVSKKQLEIMNQMLDDKCVLLDFKDIFERYEGMAQSSECKAQFQVINSTSTELEVELTPTIRLKCLRHSNRRTGSSVWEARLYQFGKWRVFNNPFDRKDYEVVEKWGKIKANAFRGVIIAKSYSYKKDIISALNSVPLKIN